MIKVSQPKAELIEANRVIDGVIVLPEGVTPEEVTEETVGRIMFESVDYGLGQGFNNGGKKKFYFESGRVADLQATAKALGLTVGKSLPQYKLLIIESFEPSFDTHQPKIYPENSEYAGETVTSSGAAVYRSTIMVGTSDPRVDQLLPTDSRKEAPAANAGMEEAVIEGSMTREDVSA